MTKRTAREWASSAWSVTGDLSVPRKVAEDLLAWASEGSPKAGVRAATWFHAFAAAMEKP